MICSLAQNCPGKFNQRLKQRFPHHLVCVLQSNQLCGRSATDSYVDRLLIGSNGEAHLSHTHTSLLISPWKHDEIRIFLSCLRTYLHPGSDNRQFKRRLKMWKGDILLSFIFCTSTAYLYICAYCTPAHISPSTLWLDDDPTTIVTKWFVKVGK